MNATAVDNDPSHEVSVKVVISVLDSASGLPPVWQGIGGIPIDDYTGINIMENVTNGYVVSPRFTANGTGSVGYYLVQGRIPMLNSKRNFIERKVEQSMELLTQNLNYEDTSNFLLKLRASVSDTWQ